MPNSLPPRKCNCAYCQFAYKAELFAEAIPDKIVVLDTFEGFDSIQGELHPVLEFMFAMDSYATVDLDAPFLETWH